MTDSYPTAEALNQTHREVYDTLAAQYATRADDVYAVTRASLENLRSHGCVLPGRALDIGCGAGVTTEVLLQMGCEVTAIDLAPQMAAVCRQRNPGARVLVGDYMQIDCGQRFAAIVAFAYIHLFPAHLAQAQLAKMRSELADDGCLLIGTTREQTAAEGYESKRDYEGAPPRYRKRWTEAQFRAALQQAGLRLIDLSLHTDPFGKVWMDAIATRA